MICERISEISFIKFTFFFKIFFILSLVFFFSLFEQSSNILLSAADFLFHQQGDKDLDEILTYFYCPTSFSNSPYDKNIPQISGKIALHPSTVQYRHTLNTHTPTNTPQTTQPTTTTPITTKLFLKFLYLHIK